MRLSGEEGFHREAARLVAVVRKMRIMRYELGAGLDEAELAKRTNVCWRLFAKVRRSDRLRNAVNGLEGSGVYQLVRLPSTPGDSNSSCGFFAKRARRPRVRKRSLRCLLTSRCS